MSDYKPITGELREKLAEYEPQETGDAFVARQVGRTGYDAMIAMCDAIDAIHAQLERENAELRAARGDDWIKLPVDADGLPICAGDDVEWLNGTKRGRVTGIGVGERDGWVWVLMEGKSVSIALLASDLHHYVPDTWERIIEDALDGYHDTDFDKLVARCKKLAGEAE